MKLEIKNLKVVLNKNEILKNLSIEVEDKSFVALLGPSGCGKSTLLKTIAGINYAAEGDIFLDGHRINDVMPHKRGTVIVFQDIRLFPHMNVIDNVAYPIKLRGIKKEERHKEAKGFLEAVGLVGYENRRVNQLSGGQQQRVALARALAAKPDVLLLDEPFSSLDENLRESMKNLVLELHKKFEMTSIMVTHDRREAINMADKVAIMSNGVIEQYDEPYNIVEHPANDKVKEYFKDISLDNIKQNA